MCRINSDIVPGKRNEGFAPLSFGQERLWILHQLNPGGSSYNESGAVRFNGPLNLSTLNDTLNEIIRRHAILRTTFPVTEGKPFQFINPSLKLPLPMDDLSNLLKSDRHSKATQIIEEEVKKPFDLSKGPLIRYRVLRLNEEEHWFIITFHHIVCDGWSIGLFTKEVVNVYNAFAQGKPSPLPELPTQYADYALWQRDRMHGGGLESQLNYWRYKLSGAPPGLAIPTDRPKTADNNFIHGGQCFEIPKKLYKSLLELKEREKITLFMVMLASFDALLHHYTGDEDVIVFSPIAGRNYAKIRRLIGFFVNTLVLRTDVSGNPTFRDLLRRVKNDCVGAYRHQDLPFQKLVEELRPKQVSDRANRVQVAFMLHRELVEPIKLSEELTLEPIKYDIGIDEVDLTFILWEGREKITGSVQYNASLFEDSTVTCMVRNFRALLECIAENPDQRIASLPILSEDGSNKLIVNKNRIPQKVTTKTHRHSIEEIYRLSNLTKNQLLVWMGQKLQPEAPVYNLAATLTIFGEVIPELFQDAFRTLVNSSDALRTVIREVGGLPQRVVLENSQHGIEFLDFSKVHEPEMRLKSYLDKQSELLFDLEKCLFNSALIKLSEKKYVWYLNQHHIISDGWSVWLIFNKFYDIYENMLRGESKNKIELPKYEDYIQFERDYYSSSRYLKDEAYWQEKLREDTEPITFYGKSNLFSTTNVERVSFDLGATRSRKLRELAQHEDIRSGTVDVSLFNIFAALLNTYLYKVSGNEMLTLGTIFHNRRSRAFKETIGLFMQMLPIRVFVEEDETFLSLINKLKGEMHGIIRHGQYSLGNRPQKKVYDVLLNYHNMSNETHREFNGSPVLAEAVHSGHESDSLGLRILDFGSTGSLNLEFDFNCDVFAEEDRKKVVSHLLRILDAFLEDKNQSLDDIKLLRHEEEQPILVDFNQTRKEYPYDRSIHELFLEQVRKRPDATAVASKNSTLTYRELNERANQLAHHLIGLGVDQESIVGLCLERSVEMIVGLLGILKAGGAYLPLDPSYPKERLAFMLRDANVSVLITQRGFEARLPENGAKVVLIDTQWNEISKESKRNPRHAVSPDNLAYIIYTSGSTGVPKGVAVQHRSVVNHNLDVSRRYGLREDDRVLQFYSISFDGAVEEIFPTLISGATLVLRGEDILAPGSELLGFIDSNEISVVNLPTAYWHEWVKELPSTNGRFPNSLRLVIVGGDKVSPDRYKTWGEVVDGRVRLIDTYGPTETTVISTMAEVNGASRLSIGRPIANTKTYILDKRMHPVPIGVAGELHIGGLGVARGYLNRPDLTAERFLPNPFGDDPGERLYRTGDLARYLEDGNIEFLGRIDHQVKIRGFRVELGEIESMILEHPGVKEAAVMAREDQPGNKRLVAYVIPNEENNLHNKSNAAAELAAEQISQWRTVFEDPFSEHLPDTDPTFNIEGWNSSYTGGPIPQEEMREWVENTANRIISRKPSRVLEIGCGTGLLLFRIAPHCAKYVGTDFSESALSNIKKQLAKGDKGLERVSLFHRLADNFEGFEEGDFDSVIINSVIRYFPSLEYLLSVLDGAVKVLSNGGFLFIGDVRSLPLLEAFHASVQLHRSSAVTTKRQLQELVQKRLFHEEELVIDPSFFLALKHHFRQISHVEIKGKHGYYNNELTRFRYDVILHIGSEYLKLLRPKWTDWREGGMSLESIRRYLSESQPDILGIKNVPNARLLVELKTLEWLKSNDGPDKVADFRRTLSEVSMSGVDPEALRILGNELQYQTDIAWSGPSKYFCFDAVFSRVNTARTINLWSDDSNINETDFHAATLDSYANNPLTSRTANRLISNLRSFIEDKLPAYMSPSSFVVMQSLPKTAGGKIHRNSLPPPEGERPELDRDYVPPRTPTENKLAEIWSEVLGIEHIGVYDNFFELGGHSLLAVQIINRIQEIFKKEFQLKNLFTDPTIATLARIIELEVNSDQAQKIHSIPQSSRDSNLPLSSAQERSWFLDRLDPGGTAYNMITAFRINGSINLNALEWSLNEIIRRHEALRTTFQEVDGKPFQVISPFKRIQIPTVDLTKLNEMERENEALRIVKKEIMKPFDLKKGPLYSVSLLKLSDKEFIVVFIIHHIIFDGWSANILINEMTVFYQAFPMEERAPIPKLKFQYGDFAQWQRSWLESELMAKQLSDWTEKLGGQLPKLELPIDHPRPPVFTFKGATTKKFVLPKALSTRLKDLSLKEGVTIFVTLLAALKILLYRYTNEKDIIVASPTSGRHHPEIENLIGFFVNPLIFRSRISPEHTFRQTLARVREVCLDAFSLQDVPFEKIIDAIRLERNPGVTPISQVAFSFESPPKRYQLPEAISIEPLDIDTGTAKTDFALFISELDGGLEGRVEYYSEIFDESTINRMTSHFQILLESIINNPDRRVSDLNILTKEDREKVLVKWNEESREYTNERCIHELFEQQVDKAPENIAVVFEDQELTYRELDERANKLAYYLQSLGVGPETLVGLSMDRSLEMIVGLLGILKAGGTYVPIDASYPAERLALIFDDSKLQVLLTQNHLESNLFHRNTRSTPKGIKHILCIDADQEISSKIPNKHQTANVSHDNLAVIFYTSGSTGKPKGVELAHLGICNFTEELSRDLQIAPNDRILQFASPSFVVSIIEIFTALSRGSTLVMGSQKSLMPGTPLTRSLIDNRISIAILPPSIISSLNTIDLPELRILIATGESVTSEIARRWSSTRKCFNLYGTTETGVATLGKLNGQAGDVPLIGRPISHMQVYLLDNRLNPVPVGVRGEIYIAGTGLARGYVKRPDPTSEKFIPNPFDRKPGSLMYRSGDFARYRPDGSLEFLGRLDNQVKIRGFRIELSELDALMLQHPHVRHALALVQDDYPKGKRIVVYFSPSQDKKIDVSEIREFLKQKLPYYMMPSNIVLLNKWPQTESGKIDRTKLPLPDKSRPELKEAYIAPSSAAEEMLELIFAAVLGIENVGINDNFFDLGGHSLKATQVISRIKDAMKLELHQDIIYKNPTIAKLARFIKTCGLSDQNLSLPTIASRSKITEEDKIMKYQITNVDDLTDEEVDSALSELLKEDTQ